jgi:hypothetical protein
MSETTERYLNIYINIMYVHLKDIGPAGDHCSPLSRSASVSSAIVSSERAILGLQRFFAGGI